jgi:hypothetical protein
MISPLLKILAVAPAHCEKSFFGLVTWYHYLPKGDFKNCSITNFTFLPTHTITGTNIPSDIPLVLLAIVDDLLRVAGIVAVGFIIYGGYQYVGSQGQSEKTARAQNTVTDALIGLAIALVAIAAVSFLGNKLGG